MEIQGAGGPHGPQPIYPRLAAFSVEAQCPASTAAPRDQVEISSLGMMMEGISRLPDIRHEKVDAIRRQIDAGVYETPEKLDKAVENLLGEMLGW